MTIPTPEAQRVHMFASRCFFVSTLLLVCSMVTHQPVVALSVVASSNYTIAGNITQWASYLGAIDIAPIAAMMNNLSNTNANTTALRLVWAQSPLAQSAALATSGITAWTANSTNGAVFLHTSYVVAYLDGLYRTGASVLSASMSGVDRAAVIIYSSCPNQTPLFNSSDNVSTSQLQLPLICVQSTPLLSVRSSILEIVRLQLHLLMSQGVTLFEYVGTGP